MTRDLWNARHSCTKCDAVMRKRVMTVEGVKVRTWECPKCKDTVLHPEDAQRMLMLNKLRKGLTVKIGELGSSLVVRIPKEIVKHYNLAKGGQVTVKAEGDNKIELEVVV